MIWPFKRRKKQSKKFEELQRKLEQKKTAHLENLKEKHKSAVVWAKRKGIKTEELAGKSAKGLAAGVAAGAMVLSSGVPLVNQESQAKQSKPNEPRGDATDIKETIVAKKDVRPEVKKVLDGEDMYNETKITKELSKVLDIPVKAEQDGIRLNKTYGIIGYESHLTRYPGDNISTHFQSDRDYELYSHASMAGGPGAWGYIAPSRQEMTQKDIEREKYYLVAQTFLSPNWGTPEVKEWFRHRKMVVVNPQNGIVVVGALEDAGPEPSTGNSFGGSPEVMEALRFHGGGSYVLMYFVDDPKDEIMSILIETFFKKENIMSELDTLDIHDEEREKLLKTADEIAELRFLHAILDRLEERDKELFLEQVHGGTSEILAEFLREKIENVEELLLKYADELEGEILKDIRNLQKGVG
jgi:hypothetical protein